jgi:hypothetical protein
VGLPSMDFTSGTFDLPTRVSTQRLLEIDVPASGTTTTTSVAVTI